MRWSRLTSVSTGRPAVHTSVRPIGQQGRHLSFFLGGPHFFFIFQCHRTIKNWKKQHLICSNLTLFIVPFFRFSLFLSLFFSFFFFFSFFLFLWEGGDGPPPPQMTPLPVNRACAVRPSVCPSVCLSVRSCIHLCMHASVPPSVRSHVFRSFVWSLACCQKNY